MCALSFTNLCREQYVSHDDPVGTRCLPCNPGITTQGAGAGFEYLCNVVIPGYGISSIHNMSGPQDVPALPLSETSGLPNATICAIGFYSLGGYCAACPGGTVTRALGATAVEECGECQRVTLLPLGPPQWGASQAAWWLPPGQLA